MVCAFVGLWIVNNDLLPEWAQVALPTVRWIFVGLSVPLIYLGRADRWTLLAPAIIFLCIVTFPIPFAPNAVDSLPILIRIYSALLIAFAASALSDWRKAKLIRLIMTTMSLFVFLSLIVGKLGLPAAFSGSDVLGTSRYRLTGLTWHPNVLGYISSLTMAWSVIRIAGKNESGMSKFWLLSVTIASMAAIVLADSRTAEIAVVLGVLAAFLRPFVARAGSTPLGRLLVIWSVIVITVLAYLSPIGAAFSMFGGNSSNSAYELSNLIRLSLWKSGIHQFYDHPAFGNGLGSLITAGAMRYDQDDLRYYHSALINYLAKDGVLGGVGFLVLIIGSELRFLSALRVAALAKGGESRATSTLLDFSIVTIVVSVPFSAVEGCLQGVYPSFLLLFCAMSMLPQETVRRTIKIPRKIEPATHQSRALARQ